MEPNHPSTNQSRGTQPTYQSPPLSDRPSSQQGGAFGKEAKKSDQNRNRDRSGANHDTRSATQSEEKARFYDLVRHLIDDFSLLFRKELALAGSEVSQSLNDTKTGIASLISGGVVLNSGYLFLLAAATLALGQIMELWLAALIVGGVVTIIGLIMVMAGKKKLEPSSLKPTRTVDSFQKDKETVKEHAL